MKILEPQPMLIPKELQAVPQWIVWKAVQVPGKAKPDKKPYSAHDPHGYPKDPTNKATCSDFKTAFNAYEANKDKFAGVGFCIFDTDPFTFVDVDNCLDPATDELTEIAKTILKKFDTYSEVSPSGTGLRIVALGKRNFTGSGTKHTGDYEIYDHTRFMTITGQSLPNYPATIEKRQDAIDWYQKTYILNGKKTSGSPTKPVVEDKDIRRILDSLKIDPNCKAPMDILNEFFEIEQTQTLKDTWNCNRPELDGPSGYRLSLINQLHDSGLTFQEIYDTCVAHRRDKIDHSKQSPGFEPNKLLLRPELVIKEYLEIRNQAGSAYRYLNYYGLC